MKPKYVLKPWVESTLFAISMMMTIFMVGALDREETVWSFFFGCLVIFLVSTYILANYSKTMIERLED